jgi:CTP synthase
MKYIIVTGGVISGIGKGVLASSIGLLLKNSGLVVTSIKIDPYLNIDAGTISPIDHGEVFVLADGSEVDLDLGCYERFLDIKLTGKHNITTGKIYKSVIDKERRGDYLGKTVQVVPNITNEIKQWIRDVAVLPVDENGTPDVCIIELGGTIGDIESFPFIEALRQFQFDIGRENCMFIHTSLVLLINGEQKTKPTQTSIKTLLGLGLVPDVIVCRSVNKLHVGISEKISQFCHVPIKHVLSVPDASTVYHVPLVLETQGIIDIISTLFKFKLDLNLKSWRQFVERIDNIQNSEILRIALVGKYTRIHDSYISIRKALEHACFNMSKKLEIIWIESSDTEEYVWTSKLPDGIIIPGGFGKRGTNGMKSFIKFARTNNIPFLGICLGFQMALVEFAKNVCGVKNASSEEFQDLNSNNIIISMPDASLEHLGGTMRLGEQKVVESFGTRIERFRHRYEVDTNYISILESNGLVITGTDTTGTRISSFELKNHSFFKCIQYHSEYQTRPMKPVSLFIEFIKSASS